MESTPRSNTPSTTGMPNGNEGILNKASSSAHAAVNSLAGAADDAAQKARPVIDRVANLAHQSVDKVAGAAAPTADWLAAQGNTLKTTQKKFVADTCSYVSANPLKSVGMAVAAGFLLSRLIVR